MSETPSSSSLSRTNDIHITVRVVPLYTVTDRSQFEVTKSEAVNWRMTDNTMAESKRTNEQTMIYKTLHRKLKFEPHAPH